MLQVYFTAWSTFFPPDLKEDFFPPTAPWAVRWTEQSLLQGCVSLIAFVSAEPSLLCYPYRVSVTRLMNHFQCLLCIPALLIRELGACFSDNVRVLKVGLHPRSTGSPSPCCRASREPERERKDQTARVHLYFPLAYDDQPENILLRDGWDRVYFKWLQKDNAVIAYLRKLPAIQRKRSHFLKCDSKA